MKKAATLFLAALMVLSLAACGDNGTTTTTPAGGSNTTKAPERTTQKTPEGSKQTTATSDNGNNPPSLINDTLVLVPVTATYKYQVFYCPYSSSGENGTYTSDELQSFMDTYGWEMGAATIPEEAVNAINEFADSAAGPFGYDGNVGFSTNNKVFDEDGNVIDNNPDVDWKGDNHGLICSTTFEIENLEEFKNTYSDVYMYFWYDNTPSVYLNGQLIFYYNTELTGNPGDWVDTPTVVDSEQMEDVDIMDLLVEGTNTITIVMKDAWGGRECAFELDADV